MVRELSEMGMRWLRFEVNRGTDGEHAAVSFMDISEEKETKIRLEQTDIVRALSRDYTEITQVDLEKKTSDPYSLPDPDTFQTYFHRLLHDFQMFLVQ